MLKPTERAKSSLRTYAVRYKKFKFFIQQILADHKRSFDDKRKCISLDKTAEKNASDYATVRAFVFTVLAMYDGKSDLYTWHLAPYQCAPSIH